MGRTKVYLLAYLVVFAAVAGTAGYLFHTLGETKATLGETRRQLTVARASIAEEQRLSREANKTANDRIAALATELEATKVETDVKRGQLEASNATVEKQKADVAASQKCLEGITRAVVSASNRNTGEAETILSSAKADCDRAYAVGG